MPDLKQIGFLDHAIGHKDVLGREIRRYSFLLHGPEIRIDDGRSLLIYKPIKGTDQRVHVEGLLWNPNMERADDVLEFYLKHPYWGKDEITQIFYKENVDHRAEHYIQNDSDIIDRVLSRMMWKGYLNPAKLIIVDEILIALSSAPGRENPELDFLLRG